MLEDAEGPQQLRVLLQLQPAVEPDRVGLVRRERTHLGRQNGQVSQDAAGALGSRFGRPLQPRRLAHRLVQLRRTLVKIKTFFY